jgi:hypothetical protein
MPTISLSGGGRLKRKVGTAYSSDCDCASFFFANMKKGEKVERGEVVAVGVPIQGYLLREKEEKGQDMIGKEWNYEKLG